MKKISDRISLRFVEPDETEFWKEAFFDSIRDHFDALNLPEEHLQALLLQQFAAQKADYETHYPQAENYVIIFDEARAGRVILSTEHDDLHLIDIAVLSAFRRRGIGTGILKWLFDQSLRTKLPIRFYVEKNNPALDLYQRLGFETIADVTTHFQMQWRAPENQV